VECTATATACPRIFRTFNAHIWSANHQHQPHQRPLTATCVQLLLSDSHFSDMPTGSRVSEHSARRLRSTTPLLQHNLAMACVAECCALRSMKPLTRKGLGHDLKIVDDTMVNAFTDQRVALLLTNADTRLPPDE
jgi:hypothetical protein